MSETRTVYRIENESGDGPYACCGGYDEDQQDLSDYLNSTHGNYDDSRHPSPYQDRMAWEGAGDDPIFGFASLEQAAAWWVEEHAEGGCLTERLESVGFGLAAYVVPSDSVVEGGTQLAFDRSAAKLIGARSPRVLAAA